MRVYVQYYMLHMCDVSRCTEEESHTRGIACRSGLIEEAH